MSFVLRSLPGHLWSGQLDSFPSERLIHGFSTRQGGVSAPPWNALNMALHVGDDPVAVRENRTRYLRALGLSLDNVCTLRQVHGTEIVRVLPSDAGRGAFDDTDALADADALITNVRGVTLLLCYADCVPVMLYDPKHHAAGLIHAGWKGTVGRIAAKTLERMTSVFGTDPLDVLVLVTEPTFPGCVMEVKPIGVFHMADEKGPDEKVICVPVSDPIWNKMNDLSDLNPHLIKEIEHFFSVYKDLEKKKVAINGWGNVEEAVRIYHECKERYIGSRKNFSIN